MDGVHDLGGRQGFGPIDVNEPEAPFHEPWEARAMAINRAVSAVASWNIDRFRFTRENIEPLDYLTRPYFDQWAQTIAGLLVWSKLATCEELAAGHAAHHLGTTAQPQRAKDVEAVNKAAKRYDSPSGPPSRFAPGDKVRANLLRAPGHTRLPAYVCGHAGKIVACHGAHVFPDRNAHGVQSYEPLYTVAFQAAELWPEAAGRRDCVNLDLWESYLAAN